MGSLLLIWYCTAYLMSLEIDLPMGCSISVNSNVDFINCLIHNAPFLEVCQSLALGCPKSWTYKKILYFIYSIDPWMQCFESIAILTQIYYKMFEVNLWNYFNIELWTYNNSESLLSGHIIFCLVVASSFYQYETFLIPRCGSRFHGERRVLGAWVVARRVDWVSSTVGPRA